MCCGTKRWEGGGYKSEYVVFGYSGGVYKGLDWYTKDISEDDIFEVGLMFWSIGGYIVLGYLYEMNLTTYLSLFLTTFFFCYPPYL